MDDLEVGVGNLIDDEEKTHFSMWAMVKSPLIIGADVNHLKAPSYSIYSQASVIAINQDPKGFLQQEYGDIMFLRQISAVKARSNFGAAHLKMVINLLLC